MQYSSASALGPLHERYHIRSQFTNGSQRPFNVLFADDLLVSEQVVIKQVNPNHLTRTIQEREETLRREEALLHRILWSDHFPRVVETFFDEGQFCLVLSLIAGTPLDQQLRYRPTPGLQHYDQTSIVNFGLAMCHLLHYLHRMTPPIIHRDIKLGNIIHCLDGSCALIDFGNAREHVYQPYRQPWNTEDTYPGIGSLGYMSPEQCYSPRRTTPASDLYSLGVIMYQMITGYYSGEKPIEEQFYYPPPIPYVTSGGISYGLAVLIMELLDRKPERRPGSASEVIGRLEAVTTLRRREQA